MFELAHMLTWLPAFALVLFRITGIMLAAPIYSSMVVPARVKIGLAALVSLVVFPLVHPDVSRVPGSLVGVAAGAMGELMVGLAIGLAVNMLIVGMQLAGSFIAQQMGLGLARIFNPTLESENNIVGQLYVILGSMLLLALDGHQLILTGVLDSFHAVPPMAVSLEPEVLHVLRGLLAGSYVMALKVAAPVLVILILVSMIMGFLGRTVPQINILVVGFPLRISVGVVALVGSLGAALVVFSDAYARTVDSVGTMIGSMGG